jgi:hypothetical protein
VLIAKDLFSPQQQCRSLPSLADLKNKKYNKYKPSGLSRGFKDNSYNLDNYNESLSKLYFLFFKTLNAA